MTYNILKDARLIKNDLSCMYDVNYGFNSTFPTNGDVDGWDIYSDICLYGSWNKVLFGTSLGVSCYFGRTDDILPITADDYYYLHIMMKLTAPEHKYKDYPSKGKIQWTTNTDSTWDDNKSTEFEIEVTDNWKLYIINMAELQYWNGNITNIRIYPFTDGYSDIQFAVKYIRAVSDNKFQCLNTQCSHYSEYTHPCPFTGTFGSITAGEGKLHYTTISGVNDTLLVDIDNYGPEKINLGNNINITGDQMAKLISDRLSYIDVGGYTYSYAEHTEDNKLKIYSGNLGLVDENGLEYEGEYALFIIAYKLLVDLEYFRNLELSYKKPLPYVHVVSGDINSLLELLYIHEYETELMDVKASLEYKSIFKDIQDVKSSHALNIIQFKMYDPSAYYSHTCYSYINTSEFTDIYIIGAFNDYSGISFPPLYVKDINNDKMLLEDPYINMFESDPYIGSANTSALEFFIEYGAGRFFVVTIESEIEQTFDVCDQQSSLTEVLDVMTASYIQSVFPYSGFFDPSTVLVTGGSAKESLGFNDTSINTYSKKPASGFDFRSSRRLKAYEINRLVDNNKETTAYYHDPDQRVVEAGRRDFFEAISTHTVANSDTQDFYKKLNGEGYIIIDATHPITDSGKINHVKANGKKYSGLVSSVIIFRPFKDGTLIKLSETEFDEEDDDVIYSVEDSTHYISLDLMVAKGDLIGFKNFGLLCPHSSITLRPNAVIYKLSANEDIDVRFDPGNIFSQGAIGPSYYAYSTRVQDSLKLDVDFGKRLNIGEINIHGQEFSDVFEYNVAACLDVSWKCNLYDESHEHSGVNDNNGTTYYWTHQNIAYGLESLSDCETTVDGGQQGTSYGSDENGLATYGEHSYFYVNGDAEWLYGSSAVKSEFSYPYYSVKTYAYEYDPVALYVNFPNDKHINIHRSVMYFKEPDNFKKMSLSYYMGPAGLPGNAEESGYTYIPEFTSVKLDGTEYTAEDATDEITTVDFILPNPMPNSKLVYVNNEATNWALYQVAGNTAWNVIEHNFDSIDCYGFMVYCDWHKSTKIVEMELFSSFPIKPVLVDNIFMTSSNYGDYWDTVLFKEDANNTNRAYTNLINSPRYFTIELSPQSTFELYELNFGIAENDLKALNCEKTVLMDNAPRSRMTSPKKVEVENVYDVPLKLSVDIPTKSIPTSNLLSHLKLTSKETAEYAEVGPGVVVEKNDDYDISLYNNQIAINCPSYYLKNLTAGKNIWAYEKDKYWRDLGAIGSDGQVNYMNESGTFKASINFDAVSSSFWKLNLHSTEYHRIYTAKILNNGEESLIKNFYVQAGPKDQGIKKVVLDVDSNGMYTTTPVIYDDFSDNDFTSYWQYNIYPGSYFNESSEGLYPTLMVSGTTSYFERIIDCPINSFEFETDFYFNPVDYRYLVGYKIELLDSSDTPVLCCELYNDETLVYIKLYTSNLDTEKVYYNQSFNIGYIDSIGALFKLYVKKESRDFNSIKLTSVNTSDVFYNDLYTDTAYTLSRVKKARMSYINNSLTNLPLPEIIYDMYFAKSIIFDCENNWGASNGAGIRQIELLDINGDPIPLTFSDYTWANSWHYSGSTTFGDAWDTTNSKVGSAGDWLDVNIDAGWVCCCFGSGFINQRGIVVFNSNILFYGIRITNYHNAGEETTFGVKDIKIYTSKAVITSTTYGDALEGTNLIFDGQISEHVQEDVLDEQVLDNMLSYTYNQALNTMSTSNIDLSALPIFSQEESIIIELQGSDPADEISLVMDNTNFDSTSLYFSNTGQDDFTLWTRNSTRNLLINEIHEAVYASGYATHLNVWNSYFDFPPTEAINTGNFGGSYHYAESRWQSFEQLPIWWLHDFGAGNEKQVNYIYLKLGTSAGLTNDGTGSYPLADTLTIYGSNDPSLDFSTKSKDFLVQYIINDWSAHPEFYIKLSNTGFYRHYCFVFTDSSGSLDDFGAGIILARFYEDIVDDIGVIRGFRDGSATDMYIDYEYSAYSSVETDVTFDFGKITPFSGFRIFHLNTESVSILENNCHLEYSNNSTDGYDGDWYFLSDLTDYSPEIDNYPSWGKIHYMTSVISLRWFKIVRDSGYSQYMDFSEFDFILGDISGRLTTSINYYNHILMVDLGQRYIVDFMRNYGDSEDKSDLLDLGISYSLTNTSNPSEVVIKEHIAKTVIFDCIDNWGSTSYISLNTVRFKYNGKLIENTNPTAYATTYYDDNYHPRWAFNTDIDIDLSWGGGVAWVTTNTSTENQRIIVVFDEITTFDEIEIDNGHMGVSYTSTGVKNVKIYVSQDDYSDYTYGANISNSNLIFDNTLIEHGALEGADFRSYYPINSEHYYPDGSIYTRWVSMALQCGDDVDRFIQNLGIYPNTSYAYTRDGNKNCEWGSLGNLLTSYGYSYNLSPTGSIYDASLDNKKIYTAKSVVIDMEDNWGDEDYIGIRSIDFYYNDELLVNTAPTAYASTYLDNNYTPDRTFHSFITKVGSYYGNQWLSTRYSTTSQRLIIVFDEEVTFDEIIINNSHSDGSSTATGAKNIKIQTSSDTIINTTYDYDVSNNELVFEGEIPNHIDSDIQDDYSPNINDGVMTGVESDYFSDWSPYKCISGDRTAAGYENCWGFNTKEDSTFPAFVLDLGELEYIDKFFIVHCYDDNDVTTWQNDDYNIYGKTSTDEEFSLLFEITGNTSLSREHILDTPLQIRYVKLEIINHTKPTEPLRIYDVVNDEYIYFDGGFVREFEVWRSTNSDVIDSESYPVICTNLKEAYDISRHELITTKQTDGEEDSDIEWDNSDDYFKYSDNNSDDPSDVSFISTGSQQTYYIDETEHLSESYSQESMNIVNGLYLSPGSYIVEWESYGAVSVGAVILQFTGQRVDLLASENIATSWASQINYLTVDSDTYFNIDIVIQVDDVDRWGAKNIIIKKASSNSKWILAERNTATDFSWNRVEEDKGVDYLNLLKVYVSGSYIPTENYWWWSSIESTLSNDVINTKVGKASLRIDYPTSSGVDRVDFIEGDHFGWDENWSIKDSLCFWLYISDIDKLYLDEGGFGFGSFYGGQSETFVNDLDEQYTIKPESAFYTWDFNELNLKTGWNRVRLQFDRNTLTKPLTSTTTKLVDESLDFKNNNYFTSFGIVYKGVGEAFYMLLDDLSIERNWFDDTVYKDEKGLCLTWKEYAEIPVGGLNLRRGSIEFWAKLYTDTSGMDSFGKSRSRTLFTIVNSNNEIISLIIKSSGWFEVGFGEARNNFNVMYADPYDYDLSTVSFDKDEPFHVAVVWSNDGIGTVNNDTMRLYINNQLVISSKISWDVGDSKTSTLRFGGGSTVLAGNNDLEGSAVFSNVKTYDYCKENFEINNLTSKEVEVLNPNSLIQISSDNVNYYDLNSGMLPLVYDEVQPGEKVNIYTRVDKTKMELIDKQSGTIDVEWEVIV